MSSLRGVPCATTLCHRGLNAHPLLQRWGDLATSARDCDWSVGRPRTWIVQSQWTAPTDAKCSRAVRDWQTHCSVSLSLQTLSSVVCIPQLFLQKFQLSARMVQPRSMTAAQISMALLTIVALSAALKLRKYHLYKAVFSDRRLPKIFFRFSSSTFLQILRPLIHQ